MNFFDNLKCVGLKLNFLIIFYLLKKCTKSRLKFILSPFEIYTEMTDKILY